MVAFTFAGGWLRRPFLALASISVACGAWALETDNFYLPRDEDFADLGEFLEAVHTHAIEAGVEEVNNRIERALNFKDPEARERRLNHCHSAETLTEAVSDQFGSAPLEKSRIDSVLRDAWARNTFPQQTVRHKNLAMNLRGRMVIDPRVLLMLVQGNTIKAYEVYFGTDKLVHFHQLGQQYYHRYRTLLREGLSAEEARQDTIHHFAESAFLAEDHGFGTILTGVYSNADMAANYLGFKFLLNLTEPVRLQGREQAPLVVRCGAFWRLNDHVRLHSGWFRPFVSDHLNEALNPSLYDASMRPHIHKILEDRADCIVEFYTRKDDRPERPEYYEHLAHELSDYYGESYGHSGQFEKLMHIGNTCIPALQDREAEPDLVPEEADLSAVELN